MPRLEPLNIKPPAHQRLFLMEGLPTRKWVDDTFKETQRDTLIIFDDQWAECVENRAIEYLFVYGRRHLGISLIGITQNFYQKSKSSTLYRNCMTCFVLLPNHVDSSINATIATKLGYSACYKAARKLFKERRCRYQYVIIRKDVEDPTTPTFYTNAFSDIPELGPNPVFFEENDE
ncbi:Oidioi.mRNA.OKI2018_I69.chr1.g1130.t1.cds [Oikopleura dioica]|uniref:Oidioi.mRNA.OKI2018_I69.YSR.g17171.t1.cds n=1 Tax=Oikopleura dioica TaxID=34765 RepID=A0ABN7SQK5_OIKDI|nr:Oidioi.mRNA.OKI2018_I69.YSR.g17171.t1.cds [Oikopleura dioica]CAG5104177.1 Oidioi.mRNA.OKI2018_I69.chr1.g1130.t1.cds [Oikopleura dioica]